MDRYAVPEIVAGLSTLAPCYRAILCDVWGVVHNGVGHFPAAVDALRQFRQAGGTVILVTNAPRPFWSIQEQLDGLDVDRAAYDRIVTSGDVARAVLEDHAGARVHHLGPDRDLPLYQGLPLTLSDIDSAELVSCTGLVDDEVETAEDHDPILLRLAARGLLMVCGNPDIVVERGGKVIPCAGAVAERYRALGGRTIVVGKPFKRIYELALAAIEEIRGGKIGLGDVLAVGDGAATDIRGANQAGIASLFITSGIHSAEYGGEGDAERVRLFLAKNAAKAMGMMPRLAW